MAAGRGRSKFVILRRPSSSPLPPCFGSIGERGGRVGDARMQLSAGGGVLPLTLARSLAGKCRMLWNQYGPSETAICATRARIESDLVKITIGCPLPNVSIYPLHADLP